MYPLGDFETIEVDSDIFISVESFENMFGKEEVHKFNYNYFENHDRATDAWKVIFDDWMRRGILN